MAEAAQNLSVPEGIVESRIFYALRILHDDLVRRGFVPENREEFDLPVNRSRVRSVLSAHSWEREPTVAVKFASGLTAVRSLRSTRQRIEAGVAFALAVACVVAASVQVGPAFAEMSIEGEPVPDSVLPAIVVGATSCPALTGPRLAAQLMAASEFRATARSDSGLGLANMGADDWKKWAPWQQAQRTDVLANVLALAHRTCKVVGQAREAGVEGNLWEAAVAADAAGIAAVIEVKGVPEQARKKVDTVVGYANWYAEQPQFGEAEPDESASPAPERVKIPDEYIDLIVKAGEVCPGILPAPRVAAQLMALSGFNPNLRGPNGGQGIAQFTDVMWKQYRPSHTASVWDPEAAIPAMGSAMCDLKNQVSGMHTRERTSDPYTLALAAYQWGVTAVRAEGGVPRAASVSQLPDLVTGYIGGYSSDERLKKPEPAPKPSASRTSPAPSKAPETEEPETEEPAEELEEPVERQPATVVPKWDPAINWQIHNALNGRVVEVPGDDNNRSAGTTIQLWENRKAKDQYWRIAASPDAGWLTITNRFNNLALGIRDGSTQNGAELVMLGRVPTDHNQQWQLRDTGGGRYFIVNRNSGKGLDIDGDDCCAGNGAAISQWEPRDDGIDQHWTLSR